MAPRPAVDTAARRAFAFGSRVHSGRAWRRAMKSAYGRQVPPPDYELTCVEPGSPMGELLRRYWQPVCLSEELKDLPRKEKLLGEGDRHLPRQAGPGRRAQSALRASRHLFGM